MAFQINPPTIPLGILQWDDTGADTDPRARLLAHINIGGLDMHLEAWAVHRDDEGVQHADPTSMRRDDFDSLCTMMDTTFTTIDIGGRDYILIATPYGD
ncbi:hypothetical protein [Rhizobium sp. SSA_523]|uniref:hypothetical protein n=1 Tax=Rhizobium sp. SSA_523 TaxID=2952477 RepID=UPI002090A96D|nr:hypothetical protein [Rhizobium sp. SSA_523]MCO5730115.1 hypothetical protein [Rhizobium sp. SSA_523]WKC25180.1 hypothetical protein QTJ18_14425 [Rhizobium sp. SSA_523]